MDESTRQLLTKLLNQASLIPDDELRDGDEPPQPGTEPLGELDATERRIYTLIRRRLDEMEALTVEVHNARLTGRMDDEFRADMIRAFGALTNEQMLLNEDLGSRLHRRLGIPKEKGIAVRQGWKVIEVPMASRASMTITVVVEPSDEDESPSDDPSNMN